MVRCKAVLEIRVHRRICDYCFASPNKGDLISCVIDVQCGDTNRKTDDVQVQV